jgi:hypothetical protein
MDVVSFIGKGGHVKFQAFALGCGCALVAACGTLPPPASSASGPLLDMRLDPPPVHALIGQRAQLQLTSEQIESLDEIGQQIHAENHPLLMQVEELKQNGGAAIAQQELLTVAGRIYINNSRAMERVRGVLTDDQHTEVCALYAGTKTTARGLRSLNVQDHSMRMVERPTTHIHVGSQPSNGPVWNWCAEDPVTTTASR